MQVWMVIDSYKLAAILTREHNIENEAIALSRYAEILNCKCLSLLKTGT